MIQLTESDEMGKIDSNGILFNHAKLKHHLDIESKCENLDMPSLLVLTFQEHVGHTRLAAAILDTTGRFNTRLHQTGNVDKMQMG